MINNKDKGDDIYHVYIILGKLQRPHVANSFEWWLVDVSRGNNSNYPKIAARFRSVKKLE